jgi:primosomal protein N' (replication factor Y)
LLDIGTVITVPLKSSSKEAIVTDIVEKPKFETVEILSIETKHYTLEHIDIARFISNYYFSSFGEAISLFVPHNSSIDSTCKYKTDTILPKLSISQERAYRQILQEDRSLLFGVTGSGKTEIFISLIGKMLKEDKTSIFLMPEISLTPQMEKRLRSYFGDRVAMWHSKLSKKKKNQILRDIDSGEIKIIAGARSALFTTLNNIGLIIVDEEHDDSYKAMTRPRYHARDVALLIGAKIGAKVLLASATPSISSYYKYRVIKLDRAYIETQKRYHFVDGSNLSSNIVDTIRENFEQSNQTLLFLPTRGNFKYLYCESCGKTHLCPYCSVGMALHRYNRYIKCHYCGYTEQIVDRCTYCGYYPLKSERMGTVEAMEIIKEQIPSIKIEQFDKDSITSVKRLKDALRRFESGESQLILGTQMLSKGHDYADITLSIILGLDYILGLADYRAREKAMSLLVQIAGRSGRAKSATVIIQSNNKETFLPYLDDYEKFIKDELEFVKDLYPPFVSLARILIAHRDQTKAMDLTSKLVDKLQIFKDIEIVGEGKAPIEKISNRYRYHILLRAKKRVPLLEALHSINQRGIEIDMDPIEFS